MRRLPAAVCHSTNEVAGTRQRRSELQACRYAGSFTIVSQRAFAVAYFGTTPRTQTGMSGQPQALAYAAEREARLRVFLEDPEVAIDTNLQRGLRPIPMGRRNWLFAWTELAARRVGAIQSLLATCQLQGLNPYIYLVDVLQRINRHPAKRAIELTPRVWKTLFADNPLRSDLDRARDLARQSAAKVQNGPVCPLTLCRPTCRAQHAFSYMDSAGGAKNEARGSR